MIALSQHNIDFIRSLLDGVDYGGGCSEQDAIAFIRNLVTMEVRMFTDEQIKEDPILKYFSYAHLKPEFQKVSALFADTAKVILSNVPRNAERTVALRKLLEAKDAAVRASVP